MPIFPRYTAPKTVSFLTKLMVEAERESVRELVNLVERLSSRDSRDSMTSDLSPENSSKNG